MGIMDLVGTRVSKTIKFMGSDIKVHKLTVAEVLLIQEAAQKIKDNPSEAEAEGFEVLRVVVRAGVENGNKLSDEDFTTFPIEDLSKLSNEIMAYSGLGDAIKKS